MKKEECFHTLCEEVNSSTIASHVEIFRQTLTFFKSKLSHVVAAIISQKHHPSGLQKPAQPVDSLLHLVWNNCWSVG